MRRLDRKPSHRVSVSGTARRSARLAANDREWLGFHARPRVHSPGREASKYPVRQTRKSVLGGFSIAKVTAEAHAINPRIGLTVLGTPEYMAPELAMGEQYDHSVDQYALAATVFESISGVPPYSGATPAAVLLKLATTGIPILHNRVDWVSPECSEILKRAFHKARKYRFDSCESFVHFLLESRSAKSLVLETSNDVSCPSCRQQLRLHKGDAGSQIRCDGCQTSLLVGAGYSRLS